MIYTQQNTIFFSLAGGSDTSIALLHVLCAYIALVI